MLHWIIEGVLLVLLGVILVEDVRHRQVYLWLFMATFLVMLYKFWQSDGELLFLGMNAGFIVLQLVGVIVFSYLKTKRLYPFTGIVGMGDLLMWGILIFGFSPFNFIAFFIGSMLLALVLHYLFSKRTSPTVPLAGWQAFSYGVVLVMQIAGWSYNFYSDDPWIKLLGGEL